jgi:hypothetical protein
MARRRRAYTCSGWWFPSRSPGSAAAFIAASQEGRSLFRLESEAAFSLLMVRMRYCDRGVMLGGGTFKMDVVMTLPVMVHLGRPDAAVIRPHSCVFKKIFCPRACLSFP